MTGEDGRRILIVDDDPGIRRMLTLSLEKHGYRTSEAGDGSEALEAMRREETDLVLLDLMMPKVTGWEVLTERAASPELRRIPIIIITAERGDRVMNLAGDAICAVLPKPFELAALRALVKSCLDRASSTPGLEPREAPEGPPS